MHNFIINVESCRLAAALFFLNEKKLAHSYFHVYYIQMNLETSAIPVRRR